MNRDGDLAWLSWVSQLCVATCLAFDLPAVSAKGSQELDRGDSGLARTHRNGCYWIATGGFCKLLLETTYRTLVLYLSSNWHAWIPAETTFLGVPPSAPNSAVSVEIEFKIRTCVLHESRVEANSETNWVRWHAMAARMRGDPRAHQLVWSAVSDDSESVFQKLISVGVSA
jgi:hypothetical protein